MKKHLFKRSGFAVLAGVLICLVVSAYAGCSTNADPVPATVSHIAADRQMPQVTPGPDQPDGMDWSDLGG